MKNHQDLQDKIFFECKNRLENLSEINTLEELLQKQNLLQEISERISFLNILDNNKDIFINEIGLQNTENQLINTETKTEESLPETHDFELNEDRLNSENLNEEIEGDEKENGGEDIIFTFVNDTEEPVSTTETENFEDEAKSEEITETSNFYDIISEEETLESSENATSTNDFDEDEHQKLIAEKEQAFREAEEKRRKIVEISKETAETHHQEEYFKDEKPDNHESHQEKKFKLAKLKGLKSVQSLFDDDPLEEIEKTAETKNASQEKKEADSGSLLKSNVPTDFMEAEKTKPEFRLDLNDKIAFSQHLFGGSQSELNDAVNQLNTFKTLDEAKEYLSDLYYEKNWKKADDFAQRLWTLVENKFL